MHLGDRGVRDGKTGEIEGRRGCGLDVLYEIRIYFQLKKNSHAKQSWGQSL